MSLDLLEKMFVELNSEGRCATPVNDWTTIYLKVFPPTKQPLNVEKHDVPILTFPKEDIDLSDWDLTTQQVSFRRVDIINYVCICLIFVHIHVCLPSSYTIYFDFDIYHLVFDTACFCIF